MVVLDRHPAVNRPGIPECLLSSGTNHDWTRLRAFFVIRTDDRGLENGWSLKYGTYTSRFKDRPLSLLLAVEHGAFWM